MSVCLLACLSNWKKIDIDLKGIYIQICVEKKLSKLYLCAYVSMCMCMCVCDRDRERDLTLAFLSLSFPEVRGHRGHAPSLAPSSQAHNHRKPMAAEEARTPPTHFTGIGPVDQSGIPIAIRTVRHHLTLPTPSKLPSLTQNSQTHQQNPNFFFTVKHSTYN